MLCPEITSIPLATIDSKQIVYGSEVNITCEKGYTFVPDRTITVRCNETGQWGGMQDTCQREYTTLSY